MNFLSKTTSFQNGVWAGNKDLFRSYHGTLSDRL